MRLAAVLSLLALSTPVVATGADPKTDEEKAVYALGALISRNFKDFNLSSKQLTQVEKGMTDALTHKKLSVNPEEQQGKLQEYLRAHMPNHPGAPAPDPKATKPVPDDKTLYVLGVLASKNLNDLQLTPTQVAMMERGLTDKLTGKKMLVDESAMEPKVKEWAQKKVAQAGEARKERERAQVEQFAKEAGAVKAASGLIYIPVKEGTGPSPKAEDKVKVHYEGKLMDGTVFDSSLKRGQPIEFPLNGVIPCWTEGVQKMKVGGKAKLVCPPAIAYGERGAPGAIPPNAALAFEVELIAITPAAAATPAPAPKK